jgi:hypothetical protein
VTSFSTLHTRERRINAARYPARCVLKAALRLLLSFSDFSCLTTLPCLFKNMINIDLLSRPGFSLFLLPGTLERLFLFLRVCVVFLFV